MGSMRETLFLLLLTTAIFDSGFAWGSSHSKVKLKDVETLTLYAGKMTTGRRSSPVPQLNCVGGSAGCSAFRPQVVQCYNRGFDGQDIQWECKSDMDNLYRFGRIQVTCEGYDYPDDPYTLKGSCGLEYTLDLTKEGHQKSGQHNYYGEENVRYSSHFSSTEKQRSTMGDLLILCVAGIVIYAIYKTCLSTRSHDDSSSSSDQGGPYPHRPSWFGWGGGSGGSQYPSAPPPPGFRQDYTQDNHGGSCGGGERPSTGGGGGGFWSGATMGGLLGYMLGNRNSNTYTPRPSTYTSYQSFGGTGEDTSYRRTPRSESSGTRTASGFGGTSRR